MALYFAAKRFLVVATRFYEEKKEEHASARQAREEARLARSKKGRSIFRRVRKTLNRWRNKIPGLRDPPVPPYIPEEGMDDPPTSQLNQGVSKEQQERLERERQAEEAERRLKRQRELEEERIRAQEEEEKPQASGKNSVFDFV